jgi:hypothetical protein
MLKTTQDVQSDDPFLDTAEITMHTGWYVTRPQRSKTQADWTA